VEARNRPDLHALLAGQLHYLNRAGFTDQIAPLMRQPDGHAQVLIWTSLENLERFRSSLKIETVIVTLTPDNWRERAEFLEAIAQQGGLELVFDQRHVFRTGQAMFEVEAQKTLTACLT
jgi:hypothetical protein